MKSKKKYYAYLIPRGGQGIANSWSECEKIVSGIVGARYKGFETREEAEAWLAQGARYEVKSVRKLERGIYFDAGTGRGHGVEVSVTDEKGTNLLHSALSAKKLNRFGKYLIPEKSATNNYGELLAMRYALFIAKKKKIKKVFGDSALVIEYWSKGHIRKPSFVAPRRELRAPPALPSLGWRAGESSKRDEGVLEQSTSRSGEGFAAEDIGASAEYGASEYAPRRMKRKELPQKTVKLAAEVAAMRKEFKKNGGVIKKISGGHNPADLGFHR